MLSSCFLDLSFSTEYSLLISNWSKIMYCKSGFLCCASVRDQQTDTGEARVVKRENERGMVLRDRQKNRGKKNDGLEGNTGIGKSKGNVLGERPKVFYCALMVWINTIINRVPLNWFDLKVQSERGGDKTEMPKESLEEWMTHKADWDQIDRAANRHLFHLILTPLSPTAHMEWKSRNFSSHRLHFMQNGSDSRYLIVLLNILSLSCCLLFYKIIL